MFLYTASLRKAVPAVLLLLVLFLTACGRVSASTPPPTLTAVPTIDPPTLAPSVTPTLTTQPPTIPATLPPSLIPTLPPTETPPPAPPPAPTQTPAQPSGGSGTARLAGCDKAQGSVEPQVIPGSGEETVHAQVYLPPCYTAKPALRYPVLYLLHGMNADDAQWLRLGVPQSADWLISTGQVRPFIVIMPQEDLSAQDPDDSQFDDWLVNVLVPWVDANYPTCAQRECRAIGGLSRGSGWAFRIGLTSWQRFGAIGMHSFSPFPGDLQAMDSWLQAFSAAQRPRLYMDIGTYDQAVPDAQQFEQKLTDLRFPHEWHLNDGAHNEDYWRAHAADYLRWYAEGWK